MKVRFPLLSLALGLATSASAHAQSLWTSSIDRSLNNVLNWTGASPDGGNLVFGATLQSLLTVDAPIAVNSLTFTGLFPAYTFSAPTGALLGIGAGGLKVDNQPASPIGFSANLPVQLRGSQTWTVDGPQGMLGVAGVISSAPSTVTTGLTKSGTGTLVLGGENTFDGGVVVQQGTLLIKASTTQTGGVITAGPVGTGLLTLAANTTFGAAKPDLRLDNPLSVANGVVLASGSNDNQDTGLTLAGRITAATESVLIYLLGTNPILLAGALDGPMNTVVRFQSKSAGGPLDGVAFTGETTTAIQTLTADAAALFFVTPQSLPETVEIQAVNGGYTSVVASTFAPLVSPTVLINRIKQPSGFAGTFGFDTEPGPRAPHVFSEDLDFSGFTHPSFQIGSATAAVLAGRITPPITNSGISYRFGNGGGALFVKSNLTDPADPGARLSAPASVVVSTTPGQDASVVILSGTNTFSGSTTTDGISSNLRVDRAAVILDAPEALPSGATYALGERAYLGYTENAGYASFADFLSHLAPGGYHATSVFGLDSHAFVQEKMTFGDQQKSQGIRVVTGAIDLGSLSGGFLGTLTHLRIEGPVTAPSSHVLQLTGVADARLTVASNLTPTHPDSSPNITSVVVGSPRISAEDDFGEGEVELTGASTYAGGTTLQGGALIVGDSTSLTGTQIASGPLGLGTLTVASAAAPLVLASNNLQGATLHNPIALTGDLQLGRGDVMSVSTAVAVTDPHLLILAGNISGPGGLNANGRAILSGLNTYTGGTHAGRGGLIFASSLSIPTLPLAGTLTSDYEGYIGIASVPVSLQTEFIDRFDLAATRGTIGFDTLDNSSTVFSGPISLLGFTSSTVRLGSATTAKLTGPLVPATTGYRFGGGGGYLEVTSELSGSGYHLDVSSAGGAALTLRLSGATTHTGQTMARNSAIIFATGAMPANSPFGMDSAGYIGTEDPGYDLNLSGFIGRFAPNLDRGIIGFDSNPALLSRTINSVLDLSTFTAATPDFYLGTASTMTFGSAASVTLPVNATAYRFAAYKGGRLQIDMLLTGNKGLVVGDPTSPMTHMSPQGIISSVLLNAANVFTGGTTFYAGNLYLGTSTVTNGAIVSGPLGTGALTVASGAYSGDGLRPTLRALSAPVTLANAIVLDRPLDVASDLTLGGPISGPGGLRKIEPGTLTLAGDNSAWLGGLLIDEGTVALLQNNSAGVGGLNFGGLLPSLASFASAAPTIGSLASENEAAALQLAPGSTLTVAQSGTTRFLGEISGADAALRIQGLNANVRHQLTLASANVHTGGTTIGPDVTVIVAHNQALGTAGPVTLNQGTLAVAPGVTASFLAASHPLVVTGGKLSGTGTLVFDTSLYVGGGGTTNPGLTLAPGLQQPGRLNLSFTSGATLVLDRGGNYQWRLADASNATGGWDSVAVTGGVQIDATALAPFNFTISSVNADGTPGPAGNFDIYSSYSWTLLTATSITGFDATKFSIDATSFLNSTGDGSFSLGLDTPGTSLMLNYTAAAIPEPSTWALLIIGVTTLLVQSWRRRRG